MSGMLSSEQGLRVRESTTSNQTVGAESSSPLLNPSGSSGPSLQRDVSSVGGAGRVLSGQRPRHQQKKHPEPLRRAVADCLSCSPHASASVFPTEAVRTVQVMSWPLPVLFATLQDSTTCQRSHAVLNVFCISVAEALWQSGMLISSVDTLKVHCTLWNLLWKVWHVFLRRLSSCFVLRSRALDLIFEVLICWEFETDL